MKRLKYAAAPLLLVTLLAGCGGGDEGDKHVDKMVKDAKISACTKVEPGKTQADCDKALNQLSQEDDSAILYLDSSMPLWSHLEEADYTYALKVSATETTSHADSAFSEPLTRLQNNDNTVSFTLAQNNSVNGADYILQDVFNHLDKIDTLFENGELQTQIETQSDHGKLVLSEGTKGAYPAGNNMIEVARYALTFTTLGGELNGTVSLVPGVGVIKLHLNGKAISDYRALSQDNSDATVETKFLSKYDFDVQSHITSSLWN